MRELIGIKGEGFYVDDTLVMREGITRFGGFLKGRAKPYTLPTDTLDDLPVLDHTPQNVLGVKRASFYFHRERVAIPGVPERLLEKAALGIPLVAISGRPATVEWADMTRDQLTREGISISEIILTPEGVSTAVSKADAIRALRLREFSDDDLKTLYYLSGLFPDTLFNYIRHRLTNIPVDKEVLDRRPNIKVIPISEWMGL